MNPMEGNFQASFIPRKPIAPIPGASKPARSFSLFSIITTIVFLMTVLAAAAAFGYGYYLNKDIAAKQEDLKAKLAKFEPALVADLSRTDSRIESVKLLLQQHMAIGAFFDFLSRSTLANVRYVDLKLSSDNAGKTTIVMNGQAKSYTAVASQALEFQKQENLKHFRDISISNMTIDKDGNVVFLVNATLNPSPILYASSAAANVTVTSTAPAPIASSSAPVASSTATTTNPRR